MSKVWIGTSGCTYDGWRGPFYPPDSAKAKWLCWYAGQFSEINGSFYLRGHGPDGRCKDHYSDRILRAWARYTGKWRRERRSVFVYFDNDQKSAAPTDARRLAEILQQAGR